VHSLLRAEVSEGRLSQVLNYRQGSIKVFFLIFQDLNAMNLLYLFQQNKRTFIITTQSSDFLGFRDVKQIFSVKELSTINASYFSPLRTLVCTHYYHTSLFLRFLINCRQRSTKGFFLRQRTLRDQCLLFFLKNI